MLAFFKSRALLFSSVVLFIAAIQLTSVSVRRPEIAQVGGSAIARAMFPLERVFHEVSASAQYVWHRYIWLIGVQAEAELLRQRLRQLESLNSRYVEYRHENQRLRELLGFVETTHHRGVTATVVGRDSSNWVHTLTIDKGSADGLRPGLPVIDGNAVVGQTTVVTPRSAKVLLLSDPASAIDAIVQSSRLSGVVEGGGDGRLRLRYTEQTPQERVLPGDRVVSSGLDGVYPKGVAIGVVHQVASGSSALFQEIVLEPSAVFDRLETVLVLLPELHSQPQGLELLFGRGRRNAQLEDSSVLGITAPHCGRFAGE